MAPQVVQEVIDWLFGKRHKKNKFYGNTNWAIPGYGLSGSRRERTYDRLLPEQDIIPDTGRGPIGQRKKVINFDDVQSTNEDVVKQRAPGIEDESSLDNRFTELESTDIDEEPLFKEEEVDGQDISDISDEMLSDEKLSKLESLDIDDEPTLKVEEIDEQKTPEIDDRYYVDEVTGLKRVLRFDDKFPKENEAAAEPVVSNVSTDVSSVEKLTPDKSNATLAEKEASTPVVLKIVGDIPETPKPPTPSEKRESSMKQETDKEVDMSNSYYVARDNNESELVQQLHPDCNVMIPSDYDNALEEIKTCPLDCPYKALEYKEIDQKSLRERIKEIL